MKEFWEEKQYCYFHPKEVGVGVCPLCLNERLIILASKKGELQKTKIIHRAHCFTHRKPPIITLNKIFALGSLLNRHRKSHNYHSADASTSQEDSFISIKFEGNGVASWEKGRVSLEHCNMSWNNSLRKGPKTVVEHAKPRASLRWRKGIGHLLQLIRWKRSNKGHGCHVGSKVEGVKVRHGWIRTLTKRTKE